MRKRLLVFLMGLSMVSIIATLPAIASSATASSSYYRNENLTPVKDQGSLGLCWAFSTIGACEAELIQNNGANKDSLDLSELHMGYFGFNRAADPLGNYMAGANQYQTLGKPWSDIGHNQYAAMNELAAWSGVVDESVAPYSSGRAFFDGKSVSAIEDLAYQHDSYHLENFYMIDRDKRQDVKQAILDYGAVVIGFSADEGFLLYSCHYDSDHHSVYHPSLATTDHEVLIVGWDDNFSDFDLAVKPSKNGAWIVRNSWGTSVCDEGYFYLSYEDKTISKWMYAYDMEPADNYDNNYQYDNDLSGIIDAGSDDLPPEKVYEATPVNKFKNKAANVFETKANGDGYEVLKAVSFVSYAADANYIIKIYTNILDDTNPESGVLQDTITGSYKYAGYHTVKTNKEIPLVEGARFSVVVDVVDSNGKSLGVNRAEMSLGVESPVTAGKSFYNDYNWYDQANYSHGAFQIKAFTDNKTTVQPTSLSVEKEDIYMGTTGDDVIISVTKSPENSKYAKLTWTSSNDSVATVDKEGKVKAIATGDAVITASAKDGATVTCNIHIMTGPPKPEFDHGSEKLSKDNSADGYYVYASDKNDRNYKLIDSVDIDKLEYVKEYKFGEWEEGYKYVTDKLETGKRYKVVFRAYYKYGDVTILGPQSDYVWYDVPLDPVTGVTVTEKTTTSISLKWDAVKNAVKYTVFRGPKGNVDVTTTQIKLDGCQPGKPYDLMVYAYSAPSSIGNVVQGTSKGGEITVVTPFDQVTGFKASNITTSSAKLSWSLLDTSNYYYKPEYYVIKNETKGNEITLSNTSSSYDVSGLSAGSYKFSIKAIYNRNGYNIESEKLSYVTVTIPSSKVDLSKCTIAISPTSTAYTGKAIKPKVVVKSSGVTVPATDYTLTYSNNVNPGTGKVVIKATSASKLIKGSITKTFTIKKGTITITSKNVTKNASTKAQTFALGAKASKGSLKYASNVKTVKVDSAGKVTIPANYSGKVTITITASATNYNTATAKVVVTVLPGKVSVSKLASSSKGQLKVTWGTNAYVSGYEIQCSLSSKFESSKTKSVLVSGAKTSNKSITKLTSKKKYYVRIRTYKTQGSTKIYSGWSSSKYITVK